MSEMDRDVTHRVGGRSVVVIGAGGNIGSHLVPHLARTPEIGRLTLIDRDVYEARNAANQDVTVGSAKNRKAVEQARRARSINPNLRVTAIAEDVERLPLGLLRADVILTCLDTRRARQYVNQAAWRLGVPWIDAGVLADGLLARVDVYVPGPESPCLECGWGEADYASLEQSYPCALEDPESGEAPPPTLAPSSLGALAASLQALEGQKLLSDAPGRLPPGGQVVVHSAHHRHYVTARRRDPNCRFSDHGVWEIEPLVGALREISAHDLFALAGRRLGDGSGNGDLALRVEGKPFVNRLVCWRCGAVRRPWRLATALRPSDSRCARCRGRLATGGFGLVESIEAAALSSRLMNRSLRAFGLRSGEVVSIGSGEDEIHFELGVSSGASRLVPAGLAPAALNGDGSRDSGRSGSEG